MATIMKQFQIHNNLVRKIQVLSTFSIHIILQIFLDFACEQFVYVKIDMDLRQKYQHLNSHDRVQCKKNLKYIVTEMTSRKRSYSNKEKLEQKTLGQYKFIVRWHGFKSGTKIPQLGCFFTGWSAHSRFAYLKTKCHLRLS